MINIDREGLLNTPIMSEKYVTLDIESYESLKGELSWLRRRVAELENQAIQTEQVPFQMLVESVKNYEIIMLDPEGYILSWNAGTERIKGYIAEEIIGQHFSRFYTQEEIELGKPDQNLRNAANLGRCEVEGWRVRQDGSQFWANVVMTALRDQYGQLVGFSKMTRDYTDRKEMQEAQARLTAILEATTDFIGICDPQGYLLYVNRAGRQMLGINDGEEVSSIKIGHSHPAWARKILKEEGLPTAIREGVWSGETAVVSHEGQEIPISQVVLSHKTPQGKLEFFSCIARDISERQQAEAEIRKAMEKEKELTELKYRFVSMAYHEFRTPLATILISSDLLKNFSSQLSAEKKLKQLNKIQVAVKRMTGLLDDTLSISKTKSGKIEFLPSKFDLEACCRDVLEEIELTTDENHSFVFKYQGDSSLVEMDEKLIRQILTNLLSNAAKYSPKGGTVYLKLTCEEGKATFQVQDEGIGIPKADREHLFEVFHRCSNVGNIGGTGLGMVIVKQAVDLHGGTITFESEEGVGTTFTVCISTQQMRGQIRCASPVDS